MRVIANPQISLYDHPLTKTKHASFLLLLDTMARYKAKKQIVNFPSRSYNLLGKKSESWVSGKPYEETRAEIERLAYQKIEADKGRLALGLSSDEILLDIEEACIRGATADFLELNAKGYLLERDGNFYLDCPRIARESDLRKMLGSIKIHPQKAAGELEAMVDQNTQEPVELSKDSSFSPSNPFGGKNIGPLFVLANLWDHKYDNPEITLASSNSVLAKYVFLRFLSRAALEGRPGFDELVVWPRVEFVEGEEAWSLDKLATDRHKADILRTALLSSYPVQDTKVSVDMSKYRGARNFVYLVANLRKVLPYSPDQPVIRDTSYDEDMGNLKYPKTLQKLEMVVRDISRRINQARDAGTLDSVKKAFGMEYSAAVDMLDPFMPSISKLVREAHGFI